MLKQLIEKYRNDRSEPKSDDNLVSNMQNIKKEYTKNKSEKNKKSVIDLLEEDRENERYDVWQCVFEDDLDMYENIVLIESKKLAEKSLVNYKKLTNIGMLSMITDLCLAKFNSAVELENAVPELKGISGKIVEIFVEVFDSEPNFREVFERRKKEREERMKRYLQEALENATKSN